MEDACKLKTISHIISKDINDMAGVPHPCQYIDLCRNDPTEICDETTAWLKNLDMRIPIWSRLYPANCVGHNRELSCTKERNYNVEIPQRLYSLWGSADTHSLVVEKMWRLDRYQWVCNVLICCAALKYNLNEWSSNLLDDIVFRGSLIFAELCQTHNLINREFRISHMSTLMQFRNTYYRILIEEKSKGFIYIPYGLNEYNLARAITSFFRFYQFGILECRQRYLAFGFATDVDQGYFMYDCQCIGEPFLQANQANACVLRTNHLQILLYCMIVAINVSVENVKFKIYNVDVRIEDPTERRVRKCVYVPTITRPVRVNQEDKMKIGGPTENEKGLEGQSEIDAEHTALGKVAVDKRFKEYNNKNNRGIYNLKDNISEIEIGENTVATTGGTLQLNKIVADRCVKELPKMDQKQQDQGDFEVSLPPTKLTRNESLLVDIKDNETGLLTHRITAGNCITKSLTQTTDLSKAQVSSQLPKSSYTSSSNATNTAAIKFGHRTVTSPKDVKQILERIYYSTNNNQKTGLAPNDDLPHAKDTWLKPQNSTNSCRKQPNFTIKQTSHVNTNRNQQPHIDMKMLRKSFQSKVELKLNSNNFKRKISNNTELTSFAAQRKQNTTKLLSKTKNESPNPSLNISESTETLKPSNSSTKTELKPNVSLEDESLKISNSDKHSKNKQKHFPKDEKKFYNSNERMTFGRKLQAPPNEKKSLQTGSKSISHSSGRKLSSPNGSKNQMLPKQTSNFKTGSDSDLIELYDVTKPNVLGVKVYLVNNRPQNRGYNAVDPVPKKIRVVKTIF